MAEGKKTWKEKHPKLATFIDEKLPKVKDLIAGILPDKGVLGIIKNLVDKDPDIRPEDKLEFTKLMNDFELEQQRLELKASEEATKRHQADMLSDSWLSKNIRPLTLIFLTLAVTTVAIIDSASLQFNVDADWKEVFQWAWMATLSFYFIGREASKMMKASKK